MLGINSLAVAQAANYQDGFFIQNEGWFGYDNGSINWFGNDGSAVYTVEQKENAGDKELLGATIWNYLWWQVLCFVENE